MIRTLIRLWTVGVVVAAALLVPITGGAPTSNAQAADLSYFDPGNIIADAIFFDGFATDTAAVQSFLNAKGASCVAGEQPCLKDYKQTTATQAGDAYCDTYTGAANESAAQIIVKVGQVCGINPRVLVVLLQKEQGLVTGTRPATIRYTKATGFACPDTSACNPEFSGFASQVYFAARQFERYAAGVAGSYRAGRNNTVLYHPNSACGSSQVFIQNKATAGLYSYTPYQPNAAALAAGYGTGDSCSSYGNRNFWNYFTDWFGSTQSAGGSAIYAKYQQMGGSASSLGAPASGFLCGLPAGGCFQHFQGGSIYWTPSTGAWAVRGAIRTTWASLGWETSALGFPVSDEACAIRDGGCFQVFQGGSVYWTPGTGTHLVTSTFLPGWGGLGYENGVLGYPTANPSCGGPGGGCSQAFQGGTLYWTAATGAFAPTGAIGDLWKAIGAESGILGYPTSKVNCGLRANGCYETFQNGSIYWTPSLGAHLVIPQMLSSWSTRGYENGALGYPVGNPTCGGPGGGCWQPFQGGVLYWSPTSGGFVPTGSPRDLWIAVGAESGLLGYPTSDVNCGLRDGGCFETFQGGSVYTSKTTGTNLVIGAIRDSWSTAGWENGAWGYPTTNPARSGDTITQRFQNGTATWNTTTGTVTFG